jgi:cytochrome P450
MFTADDLTNRQATKPMSSYCPHDPFKKARQETGVLRADMDGENIPLILRHKELREAARDTATFTSDTPCRVPIPSEESVRSVRQLPIETDPPAHTEYRALVEPFFKRPNEPEYIAKIEALIAALLDRATAKPSIEIVHEFALPLQCHALTHLMNLPESEAETWLGWGTHVFREGEGTKKGAALEEYIYRNIDHALAHPGGDDFFGVLTRSTFQGRLLTREEVAGYANIMFAGGRDTVINSVTGTIAYLAEQSDALHTLRANPKLITLAGEELLRALSPVTHIGRTAARETEIHGVPVKPGQRVSLCFASANFDETVFDQPEEVRLDRKPNPHVAFGFGAHLCLGAAHARLIIRTLLKLLSERVDRIEIVQMERNQPSVSEYLRHVGYRNLTVTFHGTTKSTSHHAC